MKNDTLLDLATDLGYELAMSGAETYRIEESIGRILATYALEAEVFSIPNLLIVNVRTHEDQHITRVRRIGFHGNDLDAVEKFSGLSRAICNRKPEPKEAMQWLDAVRKQRKSYSMPIQYFGAFLGAAGFGLFFGGNLMDSLCAGICGILVAFVSKILAGRKANQFFTTIAASFFMAMLAYAMGVMGLASNTDAVTIGALMILVPGLLFTNAMRDIIYGDTNSGINRIVQVLLVAAAIALGTATGWSLASAVWKVPISVSGIEYSISVQCIIAFFSCIGFAILFNIHGPGGLLCALGGCLSWAVYLIVQKFSGNDILAFFFSGLFASVYSEILARIRKYPAISYLVVSIFPMIPGAGVYYAMSYAMQGDMERFSEKGMYTAAVAGILAVGILLGSTVFRMYSDLRIQTRATN